MTKKFMIVVLFIKFGFVMTCFSVQDTRVEHYLKKADVSISNKNYTDAIKYLKKGIEIDPYNIKLHQKLIDSYNLKGEYRKAHEIRSMFLERLQSRLNEEPNNEQLWFEAGKIYCEEAWFTDHDKAIKCFKRVLTINPNRTEAHYYLSSLYLTKDMPNEALKELRLAVKKDPGNKEYKNLLVSLEVCFRISKDGPEILQEYADSLFEIASSSRNQLNEGEKYYYDSVNLSYQKNYQEAINKCKKALQLSPTPDKYVFLSRLYTKINDQKNANKMLKKAIEQDPEYIAAYVFLAQHYKMNGMEKQAEQMILKAREILKRRNKSVR